MFCDACGDEVYRLTSVPGIGWVCQNRCAPRPARESVLFALITGDPKCSSVRGFRKAEYDAIGSRTLDYQGNAYEHGKLIEQRPHKVALAMDKRIRENKYGLRHGQPDQRPGWHNSNPAHDTRIE